MNSTHIVSRPKLFRLTLNECAHYDRRRALPILGTQNASYRSTVAYNVESRSLCKTTGSWVQFYVLQ